MADEANRTDSLYKQRLNETEVHPNNDLSQKSKALTYEDLFVQLGGFGRFQIRTFILLILFEIPFATIMLLPALIHDDPILDCFDAKNSNTSSVWNVSLIFHDSLNLTSLHNTSTNCTDACERGEFFKKAFTTILSEWCLYGGKKFIPSLITSIQMFGVLVGALVTGQLADLYGRQKTFYVTYILLLLFSLVSAFSVSWPMYTALRFLIGVQLGGLMVVQYVLRMEFILPAHRTFCGVVTVWSLGFMLLGLCGYFIPEWRTLVILVSVLGIPFLIALKWIPESPRWLFYNGYISRANRILHDIAITNRRELPNITNLSHLLELKKVEACKAKLRFSYWHLFSSQRLAITALVIMYLWFVGSAVYYGMSLNASILSGNRYLNIFLSALVEIPAIIYIVLVNNRIGRKKTLFSLMLTGSLFCFGILIIDTLGLLKKLRPVTIAFSLVGKAAIFGGWQVAYLLSAECFPTVIRNIGVASASMAARIGGIMAPQIVLLADISVPIPFTVFGTMALVAAIVACLLPEKNDTPLPDVLDDVAKNESVSFSKSRLSTLKSSTLETEQIIIDSEVLTKLI